MNILRKVFIFLIAIFILGRLADVIYITSRTLKDNMESNTMSDKYVNQNDYISLGDTIFFDGLEITFKEAYVHTVSRFSKEKKAIYFVVKVKNITDEPHKLNLYYRKLKTPRESRGTDLSAWHSNQSEIAGLGNDLNPSKSEIRYIIYEFEGDGDYKLIFKKSSPMNINILNQILAKKIIVTIPVKGNGELQE